MDLSPWEWEDVSEIRVVEMTTTGTPHGVVLRCVLEVQASSGALRHETLVFDPAEAPHAASFLTSIEVLNAALRAKREGQGGTPA